MRALSKVKQEEVLFFDIETAPLVKELEVGSALYDSWKYKVDKTGESTEKKVVESYSIEAGLYPEFAKVVSIVVGKIKDNQIMLVTLDDEEELVLLKRFNDLIGRNLKDTLAGFVNISFDSPFVYKRMLINGMEPNDKLDSSGLKPWEVEEIDLAILWKGNSFSRASLINVATAFGLPSPKDDISGADVGRVYWNEEGGLARISAYCRKDVITTINIFKKMRGEEAFEVLEEVSTKSIEDEKSPILITLFNGGAYGKEEKEELLSVLKTFTKEEREMSYVVLDGMTSAAQGKKTKMTKTHVKALKEALKTIDND
jgi:uncharacterized protein YprB with RNaseH-like and TPR domain